MPDGMPLAPLSSPPTDRGYQGQRSYISRAIPAREILTISALVASMHPPTYVYLVSGLLMPPVSRVFYPLDGEGFRH